MNTIRRVGGTTNAPIVQLPERQHPGVVIQFDSLHNLLNLIRNAGQEVSAKNWEEAGDLLTEIEDIVSGYVRNFSE